MNSNNNNGGGGINLYINIYRVSLVIEIFVFLKFMHLINYTY